MGKPISSDSSHLDPGVLEVSAAKIQSHTSFPTIRPQPRKDMPMQPRPHSTCTQKEKKENYYSYIYGTQVQCQASSQKLLHYYPTSSSQLYEISITTAPVFRVERKKKPLRCREVKNLVFGHPVIEEQIQDLNSKLHILVNSRCNNKIPYPGWFKQQPFISHSAGV